MILLSSANRDIKQIKVPDTFPKRLLTNSALKKSIITFFFCQLPILKDVKKIKKIHGRQPFQ